MWLNSVRLFVCSYLIILGGYGNGRIHNTILEYDITGDSFKEIGQMMADRQSHAISVVQYADFSKWCQ